MLSVAKELKKNDQMLSYKVRKVKIWVVRKSELYECFRRSLAIRITQVWLYIGILRNLRHHATGSRADRYRRQRSWLLAYLLVGSAHVCLVSPVVLELSKLSEQLLFPSLLTNSCGVFFLSLSLLFVNFFKNFHVQIGRKRKPIPCQNRTCLA